MTGERTHIKKAECPRVGTICLSLLLFFCFALLLRRADVATTGMQKGLSLCARAIVPSLFPFLVLSELLVASGVGEWLTAPLSRPLGRLLGLSPAGCCAVVLGLLCGFPIGARCAVLAYESGKMTRTECERVLACSSIPSMAFLISTVGTTLWNNAAFGLTLYICTAFAALLSGFCIYVVQKHTKAEQKNEHKIPLVKLHFNKSMFPTAVRNATVSTLLICAYVVFFSTLTEAVGVILTRFGASENIRAILASILELSGGVSAAAGLASRPLAILLTGATVGWSGISVHCQMLSLTDGHNLSLRPYFAAKGMQAGLGACLLWVLGITFCV
ncbi:MAG: hypothetical protein J6V22_03805 [Clostridia bacterium]|nr:hypothetical protein [Clostridia bacterium]